MSLFQSRWLCLAHTSMLQGGRGSAGPELSPGCPGSSLPSLSLANYVTMLTRSLSPSSRKPSSVAPGTPGGTKMKGRRTQGEQSWTLAYNPVSISAFGEEKNQARAGELGLYCLLVTPLGIPSLVTQSCSRGCGRTWGRSSRAVGPSSSRCHGLCPGLATRKWREESRS